MIRTARIVWVAASALILILVAMFAIGAAFCAATLHVTRKTGPMPPGATLVELSARDGARLKAWWFLPKSSNGGCVIVLHGIGDSRASSSGFAPMFLEQGYSVLAPDSRAHGESGGDFVTYGLLEKYDVIAWAHWMHARGCQRLYGLGESLGASILIEASAVEHAFNAIVAESPYADLRSMGEYRVRGMLPDPLWVSRPLATAVVSDGMLYARFIDHLDLSQVAPLHSISISSTPVLLIHGLDDRRTPPDQSRQLAAMRPGRDRLWLVPGGGHTNASSVAAQQFRERVSGWFRGNSP